jgi:hypothetical protein
MNYKVGKTEGGDRVERWVFNFFRQRHVPKNAPGWILKRFFSSLGWTTSRSIIYYLLAENDKLLGIETQLGSTQRNLLEVGF